MKKRILSLTLALSLLLTSCGGGAKATTMRLKKTAGTVGVSDDSGKKIEPHDNLGLYPGYGVNTGSESYAWIDLDSVKLTKLDQDSEIAIAKEGKKLEIEVKSGSLFFNVTQPLADDESMNIRTSTMLVGIRGTCGWVTQDTAALLEGTVEVAAGERSVPVTAGEMAVLTADGEIEVKPFTAASVPAFVQEEIAEDEKLAETIQDTTGMDLTTDPMAPYARQIGVYFDEVLYTEFLDCEGDGKPELLVFGTEKNEANLSVYSDRKVNICLFFDDPVAKPLNYGYQIEPRNLLSEENTNPDEYSWSLVEADGRLFIKCCAIQKPGATYRYGEEIIRYYGFNDEGDWFSEQIKGYTTDYYYFSSIGYGPGLETVSRDIDAEEFAAIKAKYHEVKLLAHSPDGKSLVMDAS